MDRDEYFMHRALELAEQGTGKTGPNPLVGAVVVKDGMVVGEGFHQVLGGQHAEVQALEAAGRTSRGATLYLNLEPCIHFGRTPPCAPRIIEAGIKRVVVAMEDPNPLVAGSGLKQLRAAGVEVTCGVLEKEARELNEVFIKYITTKCPFITVKAAMSLDGKIATRTGESRWITGGRARQEVHDLRWRNAAILVGINTLIKDDPLLTARQEGNSLKEKQPVKVVVDSMARTPPTARLFSPDSPAPVIIAVTSDAPSANVAALREKGAEVIVTSQIERKVNLKKLMDELGCRELSSVLVEGGGILTASLFAERLVDKLILFIAPRLIGGHDAPTFFEGDGSEHLVQALSVGKIKTRWIGEDLLIEGYVEY